MMVCSACGADNNSGNAFCSRCGAALTPRSGGMWREATQVKEPSRGGFEGFTSEYVSPSTSYPVRQQQHGHAEQSTAVGFRCPYCQSYQLPLTRKKISLAGWIIFAALLVVCFPLCFIGLFIKEDFRVCATCGMALS